MSARTHIYRPEYKNSHALVIGINGYLHAPPLLYAENDAREIARVLREKHGFEESRIQVLLGGEATAENIRTGFLRFASNPDVGDDDRVLVFFAGHGHTISGARGEVGYLVPVDGEISKLVSLIRWDELTRNADLIKAKHVFFIMDACYGGLALMRAAIPSGSHRFVKDMLQRFSRQVLTAGKADEVVSDGNGPRPAHSIFTGHVLDALEHVSVTADNLLTANSLMALAYQKVGQDPNSRQTPHYGFLDGDGDFIFDLAAIKGLGDGTEDKDVLAKLSPSVAPAPPGSRGVVEFTKELLANPAMNIALDDFVTSHIRSVLEKLSESYFPVSAPLSDEAFAERVKQYEYICEDLIRISILLARWAHGPNAAVLEKILSRLGEGVPELSVGNVWTKLRWFPHILIMYAAGIAALHANKSDTLTAVLSAPVQLDQRRHGDKTESIAVLTVSELTEIVDQFKRLPGHERNYTPRSEYLFKIVQPYVEDLLFVGRSYERVFDRFEVVFALSYCDFINRGKENDNWHIWGPPGRFAYKRSRGSSDDPFMKVHDEAVRQGKDWPLVNNGLFEGATTRYVQLSEAYAKQVLSRINWF